MQDRPNGTVTFLFADIEGSSRLWESMPESARGAIDRYHALAADVCAAHDGFVFKSLGDGTCAAFAHATDAVVGACRLQRAMFAETWQTPQPLRVRTALHTGEADLQDGDYYGTALNRAARLLEIAQSGQILASQTTFDLVRDHLPEDVGLVDLGRHRLRDLIRPEQVYQVTHPELPSAFPELRSLDTLPHNLPVQLTSFVGREADITRVRELVARGRLLTLTGPGGCGKTRLSLQVGADLLGEYPGGVWFADLAPVTEAEGVAAAVAAALEVREEPGRSVLEVLVEGLRRRELLVILDNCEHHVAACARLVQELLTRCPLLTVLATSRESLGVPGETTWRVPSLSLPDSHGAPSVERLTQFESVRLFVERGRAAHPGFEVTGANAPAVAQICWRLDGIPLAIELAAARVRHLTVEQISARLDDRFHLLTGGSRTALPRQQTLRAALDWSWDLLPPAERLLLGRLAVFRGGWTLGAAEAICGDERIAAFEVMDLLSHLVDKSLINVEDDPDGARYGRLEMIREYSQERLSASDEAEPMIERHARYFAELAEETAAAAEAPDFQRRLKRLDVEYDNLTVALQRTLERTALHPIGWRLAVALGRYWLSRRLLSDAKHWLLMALELAARAPDATRADVLLAAGDVILADAQFARAREMRDACLALYRALGDAVGTARTLLRSGRVSQNHETLDRARVQYEEALSIARNGGLTVEIAHGHYWLGSASHNAGDLQDARQHYQAAVTAYRRADSVAGEAEANRVLGEVASDEGNFEAAVVLARSALAAFARLDDDIGVAEATRLIGACAFARGEYELAASEYRRSIACTHGHPNRVPQSAGHALLGELAAARGDFAAAVEHLDRAVAILRDMRQRWSLAYRLRDRGWLEIERGSADTALPYFEESLAIAEQTQHRWSLGYGHAEYGYVEALGGHLDAGWQRMAHGRDIFEAIGTYERHGRVTVLMGRTALRTGDTDTARELFAAALAGYRAGGYRSKVADVAGLLSLTALADDDAATALAFGRESLMIRHALETTREAAEALERLSMVLAAVGRFAPAARLFGAAEAVRARLGAPRSPRLRDEQSAFLATLVAAIDEGAVAAAYKAGQGLTLDAAVSEVIALDLDAPADGASGGPSVVSP